MNRRWLFLLLLLAFAEGACSKKRVIITGQVFVVTKGGENVKMGAVPVHVIPEESFEVIARDALAQIQGQYSKESAHQAAQTACDSLIDQIKSMENVSLDVGGLERLRKEVENEKVVHEQNADKLRTMWLDSFISALPPTNVKTDADGRFTTEANSSVWLIAQGHRQLGNGTERYLWVLSHRVTSESNLQPVLISNDSDVDTREALFGVLATLLGKNTSLDQSRASGPDDETLRLVGRIREQASKLAAETKAKEQAEKKERERLAAQMKAKIAEAKSRTFTNSLGMKFVGVPGSSLLICIHETRNLDYGAYAANQSGVNAEWSTEAGAGTENYPVVKVNFSDAEGFCRWLSDKEGKHYRLPTDSEWSSAVGLLHEEGRTPEEKDKNDVQRVHPWGNYYPPAPQDGNYSLPGIEDGYARAAPVMSFRPNALGIFDLGGNVWEWCLESSNEAGGYRVLRGASWFSEKPEHLRSSSRSRVPVDYRGDYCGFRCAMMPVE